MFAFSFSFNTQWADEGMLAYTWQNAIPDSLFVANGHYWVTHDIDPATGAEIPVSLRELAIREGKNPDFYIKKDGHAANQRIWNLEANARDLGGHFGLRWGDAYGHYAAEGVSFGPDRLDLSLYSEDDRNYWKQTNSHPGYPGTGEGNLLVYLFLNNPYARRPIGRDRRSFGSLTLLFATPTGFGFSEGRILGSLKANLVYRFYTGTPFARIENTYTSTSSAQKQNYGPIHTRIDLNVDKRWGDVSGLNVTLGLEVFNVFNQKDVRDIAPGDSRNIDFDSSMWQTHGISALDPVSVQTQGTLEIFDVNNYWDQPREMKCAVRVKW